MATGAHARINGIRQHYLHFPGPGPRVVIVPGIVSPAMLWHHVGSRLSQAHDCYILDVRGRGLSESGPHLDYGVDACAADLTEFVSTVTGKPTIVIGHSMGARIALRAAATFPGVFQGLVLLDPPTSGPGRRPYPIPKARTLKMLQVAQRGEPLESLLSSGRPWPADLQRLRAEWLPTCDERAVHVTYDDFHGQDMFADLERASEPISLICAGEGGVVDEADLEEMHRRCRHLWSFRLPEAGHQMQAENFEAFYSALVDMLNRHRSNSQGDFVETRSGST